MDFFPYPESLRFRNQTDKLAGVTARRFEGAVHPSEF